ncbi:hypothetical protein L227DRAFT_208840 [Lentinus tigrinus ALCF2SS1-6]|uniref:Uncharacterized protein n=1 Tax=Lentinus tigrinus ALCF2SS1-6 TaxID=1328759 RepID=A0A5C2SPS4_9APHY|nr:hypothetical protein L227DRAFT_208840 [Lentinus tigrinus ALCF2SS1-6]
MIHDRTYLWNAADAMVVQVQTVGRCARSTPLSTVGLQWQSGASWLSLGHPLWDGRAFVSVCAGVHLLAGNLLGGDVKPFSLSVRPQIVHSSRVMTQIARTWCILHEMNPETAT